MQKILYLDIETSPNLGYVWDLWNQNISLKQLHTGNDMLCYAALWDHDPDDAVQFCATWLTDDAEMVRRVWHLLDECDILVTYNGKKFDTPWLQRKFVEHGLTPPSPFKQVDLYLTVRREFNFPSNKLAYVADHLLGQGKLETGGFGLWIGVINGDVQSQVQMMTYCKKDTILLRPLHKRLLPWIRSYPSHAAVSGLFACPKCDSQNLTRQGYKHTQSRTYQQYRCSDCGGWSRDTRCVPDTSAPVTETTIN